MPRLFVHIGTGKTGSTAIQQYLATRRDQFAEQGIHYWGLNLEGAQTTQRFPWQKREGISILQQMPEAQATQELSQALFEALGHLKPDEAALWTNESIYERPAVYIPLFQSLDSGGGCEINLIAYARSMRSYIHSAYKQWGIKHKTYSGRLLGFTEWVNTRLDFLSYGSKLSKWDQTFPENFSLVNYDSTVDVVRDFLRMLSVDENLIPSGRKRQWNESPSSIPLAVYALFNNQYSEPRLPSSIASLLNRYKVQNRNFQIEELSSFFPSSSDLDKAEAMFSNDTSIVNSILEKNGQPSLVNHESKQGFECPSKDSLYAGVLSLLLGLVVEQDEKIQSLESKLNHLDSFCHAQKSEQE